MHYHCCANTPGYMPEGDPYVFTAKRDAVAWVADAARQYRENEAELPTRQRRTGRGSARSGRIHFERPGDAYDLGLSFWWESCEGDCPLGETP